VTQLLWRIFRHNWRVQAAVTCLFTVSIALLIVYGAYMERQVRLLQLSVVGGAPEDLIYVQTPYLQPEANPLRPHHGPGPVPVVYLGSWRLDIAHTNIGTLPVVVVGEDKGINLGLGEGEVALPAALSQEHGLSIGEELYFRTGTISRRLAVAEVHNEAVFGGRLVMHDFLHPEALVFLYRKQAGSWAEAIHYLRRSYPTAVFTHAGATRAAAKEIIDAVYAPTQGAVFGTLLFVAIAFLTVTVFSFLTKRRLLAITKTLGLRAFELAILIAGEAAMPPLLGSVLGSALGYAVLRGLIASGQELAIVPEAFSSAVLAVWPAVVLGIAIPSRFAQVATATQLLYERPIPLQTVTIKELSRRFPGLDKLVADGVKFVKLQVDSGHFNGIVFRRLGDFVKQGEVLAVEERWWGMQVVEYHSPATGEIVFFEPEIGMFGVQAALPVDTA